MRNNVRMSWDRAPIMSEKTGISMKREEGITLDLICDNLKPGVRRIALTIKNNLY